MVGDIVELGGLIRVPCGGIAESWLLEVSAWCLKGIPQLWRFLE